jgi:hypothetical protein
MTNPGGVRNCPRATERTEKKKKEKGGREEKRGKTQDARLWRASAFLHFLLFPLAPPGLGERLRSVRSVAGLDA